MSRIIDALVRNYQWYVRDPKAIGDEFKHKVHSNVINNIFACHFFDFMRFLIQCPKEVGYFNPRMLAHWLKSRVY